MRLIIDSYLEINDYKIYLRLFELYKSFLLLISDNKDFGIGNVTIATPIKIDDRKTSFRAQRLFGIQQELVNQIIAEKFCSSLNAPILLLLFFSIIKNEKEILTPLIKKLVDILQEIKNP